jgi:hypothetical protein
MPDDPPGLPPEPVALGAPRRRRRLMLILMTLLGILVLSGTLLRYQQLVGQEPSWSYVLARIRAGAVVEIQLGPASAVVVEGKGSPDLAYQVRYPGGRLSAADRATLNGLIEEREAQARRDENAGSSNPATPITITGLPPARRFWPW